MDKTVDNRMRFSCSIAARLHQATLRPDACVGPVGRGQILRAHGTHGETDVAEVVVRDHAVRIEVDVPREVRAVRVERTGPVVAVGTNTAEARVVAVPGSREEKCSAG